MEYSIDYSDLPEANEYIEKRNRDQAKKLRANQARLIAQYKFEDVSMVIYDWNGDEYEEPYVIMIHTGEISKNSLHRPEFDSGIYSPDTVIKCINAFLNYRKNYLDSNGDHNFSNQITSYINEPWDSLEEYKDHKRDELHESAREEFEREIELQELHESAREEFKREKELRELHESAREEWKKEKRSREIVRELEKNQHEYNLPEIPEVPEDRVQEIRDQYSKGEITLLEMEREIEEVLQD